MKLRPYYEANGITLYHGDFRQLANALPRVDAIVTDPPYNETSLSWDVWPAGWPVLAMALTSSLWCFGSLRMFLDRRDEFGPWKLAQDVIWEKHNGSGSAADRFRRVHEMAVHFYRGRWSALHRTPPIVTGEPKLYKRGKHVAHWGAIGPQPARTTTDRLQRSVIYARSCHHKARNETEKPEEILAPLVHYSVPVGGVLLDPFAGSGATLKVARDQNKRAIGVELRESQCREIVRRLET